LDDVGVALQNGTPDRAGGNSRSEWLNGKLTPEIPKPNGDPYSYNKLVKLGDDETQDPKGMSDYFYYEHDAELAKAGSGYTTEHAQADINLIESLTLNDTSYSNDAEATLYDGFATLAMIGRLLINDQLDQISPTLLLAAATDAVNDIEYGLQNLPTEEQTAIPPVVLSRRARTSMDPRGGVATRGVPGRRGWSNSLGIIVPTTKIFRPRPGLPVAEITFAAQCRRGRGFASVRL
jgi:hypothetical protein